MIILGIDPGSRITGFGVIQVSGHGAHTRIQHINHGVILMKPTDPFPLRMKEIGEGMQLILRKYKPAQVAIEKIFLGRNADSAFKLGHARGVALYESARFGCEVFEYATRLVKKGITGRGGASKEEVQASLEKLLNLKAISRIDASDALALATFHAFRITNPLLRKAGRSQNLDL
ncbi:MAG: crossover junction endodeoxyribonuclease RuvC [Pseudobdellovibrionaceae bacterium]